MNTLEDLLTFYSEELDSISIILKKYLYINNFECLDSDSNPIEMKNQEDLVKFLKLELNSLIESLDSLERNEP